MNFGDSIKNIVNVIRLWSMRKLTFKGKITIFKSVTISKIVYLALLTTKKLFLVKCGNRLSLKMRITLAKSQSARGVSHQPAFMDSCDY